MGCAIKWGKLGTDHVDDSDEEAAAIPEAFLTAFSNIFMLARARRGESILIHGGGSGVGTAATTLCKLNDMRVIVTAGSDEKCAQCIRHGADVALNYGAEDFVEKAKGVDIAFAKPKSGAVMIRTSMHIVANSAEPKLALDYIDALLSPEVQGKLEVAPYNMFPSNGKVKYTGENARQVAKDFDELSKSLVLHDWAKIQDNRPAWIERFNKEVKA